MNESRQASETAATGAEKEEERKRVMDNHSQLSTIDLPSTPFIPSHIYAGSKQFPSLFPRSPSLFLACIMAGFTLIA